MSTKVRFLDAHTHVQFLSYENDRDEVIQRARDAGVRMIMVGTQATTSEAGIKLAEKYPEDVWAAVGFHPSHTNIEWHHDSNEQAEAMQEKFDPDRLRELAKHPKVVAIGECGLDYYRTTTPTPQGRGSDQSVGGDKLSTSAEASADRQATKEKQKEIFLQQIEIAHEAGKPLMIHCREAFGDLIDVLKANTYNLKPSIVHSFDGTVDEAKALLDMGFSFTFAGNITFKPRLGRPVVADTIKFLPIDRILSETDAPYLTPVPHRGERNEPAYVIEVVKKLAEIKNVSAEEMAGRILENASSIFVLKT